MSTLFRAFLALVAAVTCLIAGWAALQSAHRPETPRARAPADLTIPDVGLGTPKPALPALPSAAEASGRRNAARVPASEVAFRLDGDVPATGVVLRVRRSWSRATVAVERLEPGAVPAGVRLAPGDYEATLEGGAGPASWLARVPFTVPAEQPVPLSLRTGTLTVHVRDGEGTALARVPVHVARADDPSWVAPVPERDGVCAPITDALGAVTFGPLGAGDYEVALLGDEAAAVTVTVPDRDAVTLAAALRR